MGKLRNYNNMHDHEQEKRPNPNKSKAAANSIKVRFISSPIMVKAKNASEFRSIVQELTGKDSSDVMINTTPRKNIQAGRLARRLANTNYERVRGSINEENQQPTLDLKHHQSYSNHQHLQMNIASHNEEEDHHMPNKLSSSSALISSTLELDEAYHQNYQTTFQDFRFPFLYTT